jgi:hypothetical protein
LTAVHPDGLGILDGEGGFELDTWGSGDGHAAEVSEMENICARRRGVQARVEFLEVALAGLIEGGHGSGVIGRTAR